MTNPERRPRITPAEHQRQTALVALQESRVIVGRLILLPSLKEVNEIRKTTTASVTRGETTYPEIIESQTGLAVVHNGYVGHDLETSPLETVEAQAKSLPLDELKQLVASLKVRVENLTHFELGK